MLLFQDYPGKRLGDKNIFLTGSETRGWRRVSVNDADELQVKREAMRKVSQSRREPE